MLLLTCVMPLLIALLVAAFWAPVRRDHRLKRQLGDARVAYGTAAAPVQNRNITAPLAQAIAAVGSLLTSSGLLSAKSILNLESTLAAAGMRGARALPIFVGAKVLLLTGVPVLTWLLAQHFGLSPTMMRTSVAVAAVVGLMAPDIVLRGIRKRYLASVERAMPDALDLLVICAEAGLALEQGMERVAREIRISSLPCALELETTHNELRILPDRRTALINMGRRTGLVSLQRLGGTMAQALRYGTPLSQALRSLAADMRGEALTRFEARASRLPVLMTLPMILFILPCVFVVVAGPAMLAVFQSLR
jgi:tight adherence protein C